MKYTFLSVLFFITEFVLAEPYIPNNDYIVAPASSLHNAQLSSEELQALLLTSQNIGQTELNQGLLKHQLSERYHSADSPEISYLYARVLQREHLFNEALAVINTLLKNHPEHLNARLLKANMLMVQGLFSDAKQQCLALFGIASIETISTCTFDIASQNGQLATSYQSLLKITQGRPISQYTRHVLAEMALRLAMPQQALKHIESVNLKQAPVSLLVVWADAQLASKNYTLLTNTITSLVNDSSNLEDALLLRLAQAEKNDHKNTNHVWQKQMAKRVTLRELRHDTFHASDLANYYLTIDKNSKQALYWATINWQTAKLHSDKLLLSLAKKQHQGQR
ncbi:hypothetical protein [Pseudoalteromonas mariniglutinosa]|uniref:hypothetical protein n=1 Tax=Pseudoalteromonas mariniglutinosa TaxID=206042 RepID=UPI00384B827B